jgi:hypothetical protein
MPKIRLPCPAGFRRQSVELAIAERNPGQMRPFR